MSSPPEIRVSPQALAQIEAAAESWARNRPSAPNAGAIVNRYDPSQAPDSNEWLDLAEQERAVLVERYHRAARVDLPNLTLHASIHVAVENQLASNDEPVVRALARLMKDGLTRHDAVHAIGSVVAGQIYDLLSLKNTPETSRARYYAAIERLTAAQWRDGSDG